MFNELKDTQKLLAEKDEIIQRLEVEREEIITAVNEAVSGEFFVFKCPEKKAPESSSKKLLLERIRVKKTILQRKN